MKDIKLILTILGAAYILIGGGIAVAFLLAGGPSFGLVVPLLFVVLGICFIAGVVYAGRKQRIIRAKGEKFPAKIYSYKENTSYTVNGAYPMNTVVRFFDKQGVEREAVIPTSFPRGSSSYPIGMTIDIFEYRGSFSYDPDSVRSESLPREAELMDSLPLDPSQIVNIAVDCPNCGASFKAVSGAVNSCPYCGGFLNVQ